MKILQAISQLGNGGAEKLVVELCNELDKGNEVVLLSFRRVEEWMFFPKKLRSSVKLIELNKQKGFNVSFILELFKVIKAEKPDVINTHLCSTLKYFMFIIPLFSKIKFFHTIHSEFKYSKDSFSKLSKIWFFKRVNFVCLSDNIKKDHQLFFKGFKFYTIGNGIASLKSSKNIEDVEMEINKLKGKNKNKIFLFVGRLGEEKNIPLLLKIFSKIDNSRLLIIGSDPTESKVIQSKIKKCTSKNIIYLGAKENVQDYMMYSDALVLASIYEGLPMVVLEAMSIGLPVLSTPVGSLPAMIKNGKNGFISDDISEKSYMKVVELFLKLDKIELEQIRDNNIKMFYKDYSMEICAKNYLSLYNGELK